MFENITSYGRPLEAELNDAILCTYIADYQTALRIAEHEANIYEQCGNDRMKLLMDNQATHYRHRIAELQAQMGVQGDE